MQASVLFNNHFLVIDISSKNIYNHINIIKLQGTASSWAPLLATYPQQTLTPILWDEAERQELLKGSTVLNEARTRQAALQQEWQSLLEIISADTATYPAVIYTEEAFMQAMSVVLAYGSYLPSAQCFALLPLVGTMNRTGSAGGAILDYDLDRQSVTLVASQPTRYILFKDVF